ncbi:hypothetical protein LCGC14_1544300 [marine sediment metagenome]|uniref:Uncharacterized protein n=1 Tax=marine sediment metagenome TaxID=412755 RepID=A0A0F9IS21_9ZZZZ
MAKQKKLTEKENEVRRKKRKDREAKAFQVVVDKLKKEKSEEELLKIVSIQPENHELNDFMAARKALDELKVPYEKSFK